MSLLNLKLRQENAVNINMCSIITKYPFNVLRSNCLVMVVLTICILIISLIQNVAIVPQVQTSHPGSPVTGVAVAPPGLATAPDVPGPSAAPWGERERQSPSWSSNCNLTPSPLPHLQRDSVGIFHLGRKHQGEMGPTHGHGVGGSAWP